MTCAPPLEGSPATFKCPADNAPGMQLGGGGLEIPLRLSTSYMTGQSEKIQC